MSLGCQVELYEDNAGGLAILHNGQVYRGMEHLEDGTTFSDFASILTGTMQGDPERFAASGYPIEEKYEPLVARWTPILKLEIVGSLGVAGKRFIGEAA